MEESKDLEKNAKSKKKFKINKYVLNIIFVLAIASVAFYFLLKDDFNGVVGAIRSSDKMYLLYMILVMLGVFLVEGVILLAFARLYTTKYKLHQGVANCMIGTFYNGITPSSSGGQFVQAYTFKKQGIDMASAASILVMHFIVTQAALIIFGMISLITRFNKFVSLIGTITLFDLKLNVISLSIIGFAINLLVIVGLLVMSYSKKIHTFILNTGVNIGAKLKFVRDVEKTRSNLQMQVENFRIELRRLQSNIPFTILVIVLALIKYVLLYSVPFLAGKALHAPMVNANLYDGITMASFLSMVTGMIPLPGASGGAEYFFEKLFTSFYGGGAQLCHAANILWRTVTYYFGLILGGLVSAFYHTSPRQIEDTPKEFKTFVDLQLVTMEERKISSDTAYATKQLSRKEIEERLKNLKKDIFHKKRKNKGDK